MPYKFNPFTGTFDIVDGTGSPGGSDTQVQFNNAGAFGGDANFTFNSTTDTLTIPNIQAAGSAGIALNNNTGNVVLTLGAGGGTGGTFAGGLTATGFSVGASVTTGRITSRGSGATSSTTSLLIENSSAARIIQAYDNNTTRIDTRLAVNADPNSGNAAAVSFYVGRTDSSTITASNYAARYDYTLSAQVNFGAFPSGFRADAMISAGANTINYTGGMIGNVQIVTGHTGQIENATGAEVNVRHQGQANIVLARGGVFSSGFFNATGTGTITTNLGGLFAASSVDGPVTAIVGTNVAGRFETRAPFGGITTNIGVEVRAASASASRPITTNYGIKIAAQNATGITTGYGIFFDGTEAAVSAGIAFRNGSISLYPYAADILGLGSGDSFQFTAGNIITDTTTGTKIGTATTQKLGFWNATPVVQPTTAITAGAFVANTSGIVDDSATFDGYTIGEIAAALRQIGLLA